MIAVCEKQHTACTANSNTHRIGVDVDAHHSLVQPSNAKIPNLFQFSQSNQFVAFAPKPKTEVRAMLLLVISFLQTSFAFCCLLHLFLMYAFVLVLVLFLFVLGPSLSSLCSCSSCSCSYHHYTIHTHTHTRTHTHTHTHTHTFHLQTSADSLQCCNIRPIPLIINYSQDFCLLGFREIVCIAGWSFAICEEGEDKKKIVCE